MSGAATVGSLNIEVQLELQKMQGQFDKLEGTLAKQNKRIGAAFAASQRANQRAIEKTGDSIGKMALKFVTAEKAISFFKQRLTAVFNDPLAASQGDIFLADSVTQASGAWSKFTDTIDYALARISAAGGMISDKVQEKLGAALDGEISAMQAFREAADDIISGNVWRDISPDERARANDKNYNDKLAAAEEQLRAATRAKQMVEATEAEKILALRERAAEVAEKANKEGLTSLEIAQRKTAATNAETAALSAMVEMRKQLAEAEKEVSKTTNLAADSGSNPFQTARAMNNRAWAIRTDISNLKMRDQNDPKVVQELIDKNKELATVQERLARAQMRSAEMGQRAGETITDGLSSAIFSAKSAKDAFDDVVASLAQMVLQQAILAPIAKSIGGGLTGLFGGFFADGGTPPLGKISMVGERGPELFVPKTSGVIVPNDVTRSMLSGSGGSGTVVQITNHIHGDAVSKADLAPLFRANNRALEAQITDALSRGGGKARRFGG